MWGRRSGSFSPTCGYIKNRSPEMMSIFVTYVNIRNKNYLKLTIGYLNSPQGEVVPYHALAIAIFKNGVFNFKKIIKKDYSDFSNVTFVPCSSIDTTHSTVSPFSKLYKSLIIFGIDVDNVPPVDWTLVLYFNFIPPYIHLIIFIIIYLVILSYKF